MLTEYIQRAMRRAKYELMENGRFYGHIPDCPGTWGEGPSLEECRDELQSVLEDWLMITLRFGDPLPVIDGLDLNPPPAYAQAGSAARDMTDLPQETAKDPKGVLALLALFRG